jgi:8-oxo-dGTP pyrophosphatase MutT (NUDIX family)
MSIIPVLLRRYDDEHGISGLESVMDSRRDDRNWHGFKRALRSALAAPLPGGAAQESMAPAWRGAALAARGEAAVWKPASVLVLLFPGDERPESGGMPDVRFPLVERSSLVGFHRGEIALPGGSREADETALDAALREAREELRLDAATAARIEVLGRLSALRVPPSGFEMSPFVAALDRRPPLAAAMPEIEDVIETRLDILLAPGAASREERELEGRLWNVPYYLIDGRKVWGATAMVLAELAAVLLLSGIAI